MSIPVEAHLAVIRREAAVMEGNNTDPRLVFLSRFELREPILGFDGSSQGFNDQQVCGSRRLDGPDEGGRATGIGAGPFPLADQVRIDGLELKNRDTGRLMSQLPQFSRNMFRDLVRQQFGPFGLNTSGAGEGCCV